MWKFKWFNFLTSCWGNQSATSTMSHRTSSVAFNRLTDTYIFWCLVKYISLHVGNKLMTIISRHPTTKLMKPSWLIFINTDGLVQERLNSIVNALEICLSCTNPLIQYMPQNLSVVLFRLYLCKNSRFIWLDQGNSLLLLDFSKWKWDALKLIPYKTLLWV